jgi:membrane fusion protein, multidrug efflux system
MKHVVTVLASLALIGIVGLIGWLLARQKLAMMSAPPPPFAEQPESVRFASPEMVSLRQSTTAVGTVLAPRSVQLRTEVAGTVASVTFQAGSEVKEGDLLLKLDTSVEEAQLASAEAAKKIADSTFKRTQQAANVRAISDLELEQASSALAQASAEVLRLNAVIRKKTIRAPFLAKAGLFDIHPGQYLPEGTAITMLQGVAEFVYVDFMMPQQAADEVHAGDQIRLLHNQCSIDATIVAIDSQSDRVTRNLPARAKVVRPPETLLPNDSVRVELEYGSPMQAMAIPAAALRRSPSGTFIYLAVPDAEDPQKLRAQSQVVVVGKSIGQKVAILSGLALGQSVVSDGSFKLRNGAWVSQLENLPQ